MAYNRRTEMPTDFVCGKPVSKHDDVSYKQSCCQLYVMIIFLLPSKNLGWLIFQLFYD